MPNATSRNKCSASSNLVMKWPGNSADRNPIENLWAIIKRRTMGKNWSPMIKVIGDDFQARYHDEEVPNMCQKLLGSMANRIAEVIKEK